MTQGTITRKLEIHVAWWLRTYLAVLVWASEVTGLEPDWDKLNGFLDRGISVKVK